MIQEQINTMNTQWAGVLTANLNSVKGIGAGNGLSGAAIFLLYHYQHTNAPADLANFYTAFDKTVARLTNKNYDADGFWLIEITEFMYMLRLAGDLLATQYDLDELTEQIHGFIETGALQLCEKGNYDPYTGCFFQAHYLLQYTNSPLTQRFELLLKEKTVYTDATLSAGYFDSFFEPGDICLSITHGLSFYIIYLCALAEQSKDQDKWHLPIIRAYTNYMMAQRLNYAVAGSFFPDYVQERKRSRLCLCYGDLGVFYALLKAARLLNDLALEKEVLDMLIISAGRTSAEESGITGWDLLYGCGGVYWFYEHLSAITGMQEFSNIAANWRQKVLSSGLAAAVQAYACGKSGKNWQKDASFQEGITGALTVLGCQSSHRSELGFLFYLN